MPSKKNPPRSSNENTDESGETSDESSAKSNFSTTNSLRQSTCSQQPSKGTLAANSDSSQTSKHTPKKRKNNSNPKVKKKRKTKKDLLAEAAILTSLTTSANILQTHHVDLEQNSDRENVKVKPRKAVSSYANARDWYGTPIRGGKDVSQ
ncbi:uncharacterized protein MELLADRAFT_60707 [Melampsora larici-populina 98AG31]|uniref:Uncharacterized protein n=1 Tax=Melampsora larici-populina (strain 98AG31 / pathotype 3-4-7) TaxID=747676 RepID=F4RC20_MELLP|nr:uncharacterized protein MELLADRAFT_60707 [Melampsora larici-populina 98AG31]EGG10241.1 hypothetical protein MELLADRAFT_60707 [Melampsora larici-populina 98AG31]